MIAFKYSKNLNEIIGGHTPKQRKIFKKSLDTLNKKSITCSLMKQCLKDQVQVQKPIQVVAMDQMPDHTSNRE